MARDGEIRYWKCLEERDGDAAWLAASRDEFPEPPLARRPGRREFLQAAGFLFGGAFFSSCSRAPVEKLIASPDQPEELVPGTATWYASTCDACSAGCGLLVKTRDGRPIKLEGNPEHPISRGGLCAVGQASLLGLYDNLRFKQPLVEGREATWEEVDRAIGEKLDAIRRNGGAVRFLTGTIHSPTVLASIESFLGRFADARHVVWDPLSSAAILDAHQRTHGVRRLPRFFFDKAAVIVSLDADFLGAWISPVEHTAAYQAGRQMERPGAEPSFHVQFESRLSLTGTKADRRVTVRPQELGAVAERLAALIAERAGAKFDGGESPAGVPDDLLQEVADQLWESRGRSLVVSGSQDVEVQTLCNFVNHLLGNYGRTLDLERPSLQRQGSDVALQALLEEMNEGRVAALLIAGLNPAYELPASARFVDRLKKVPLVVSFAERPDETTAAAHFVCPDHHFLESWGDREPVAGVVSLIQPMIRPLGSTRALVESLAAWTGRPRSAYEIVRDHWRANFYSGPDNDAAFRAFWEQALSRGFIELESRRLATPKGFSSRHVRAAASPEHPEAEKFTLVLYPKIALREGRHAYNPWLQELPDPITKVTWDNYACLSPAAAERLGLAEGDVVRIEAPDGGAFVEVPVFVQPGQHDQIVALALGYGSALTERFAGIGPEWIEARPDTGADGRVGVNAAPMLDFRGGTLRYERGGVKLAPTGRRYELASTQTHHAITVPERLAPPGGERRPMIQETSLARHMDDLRTGQHWEEPKRRDLWPPDHPFTGHRWAMVIDLSACTGCSACVVACQAENNIPVVGKDEVRRKREMQWMRIDRYYAEDGGELRVAHQPMLCQQCEHAPCETVCPVLATVHSEEGLNQQIYNRCVGTRYCANNCPYKVRRFNWFEYRRDDRLANLVLNPDVTVRSRGVMEKCTFCVQRIQEAKIEAKRRGGKLEDGAIQPACQQSCPAGAIVFGDLNDPKSRVAQLWRSPRRYQVLEEINVRPSVTYLKLVRRDIEEEERSPAHG